MTQCILFLCCIGVNISQFFLSNVATLSQLGNVRVESAINIREVHDGCDEICEQEV